MQENVSSDKEEESPEISEDLSDESDREDIDDTEKMEDGAEETQQTGAKSCDVLSSEGGHSEMKSENSASLASQLYVDEMETISVGGSLTPNQLIVDQGIFSGTQKRGGKRAGPMITEIVLNEGDLQICNITKIQALDLKLHPLKDVSEVPNNRNLFNLDAYFSTENLALHLSSSDNTTT